MNPFEVLEVSPGATPEEIKAAYHRLAKRWHPDRYSGEEKVEAENRFRMLAEAFNMLKDHGNRAELGKVFSEPQRKVQDPSTAAAARPLAERTAEDWFLEAKEASEAKDYSRALGLVHYTLRMDPGRADAHVLLAQLLDMTGGDKRALVNALENAVRLNPKDVDSMIRLADVFQALGMQAKAVRIRESAKQMAPQHKAFRTAVPKPPPPATGGEGLLGQLRALIGRLLKRG